MDPLAQLVGGRQGSPLSDILQEAPKLVDSVSGPEPESAGFNLTDIFKPAQVFSQKSAAPEPEEPAYIPLTPGEIESKAASKSQMWGAIIALFFGFVHRYGAYQKLREGDKQLIKAHDQEYRLTGALPVYPPEHPYHAARERWEDFEEALKDADEEATLSEDELSLLRRAIEADLKAKNKRGALKTSSIAETLFEIMVIKAMGPAMQFSMMTVNKMVDKSMR